MGLKQRALARQNSPHISGSDVVDVDSFAVLQVQEHKGKVCKYRRAPHFRTDLNK